MIVPMKKIRVITQSKDAEDALKILRKLGIFHVEHQKMPQGKDINLLEEDISLVNKSLDILKKVREKEKKPIKEKKNTSDWKFKAKHITDLDDRIGRLNEYSRATRNRIEKWQSWGNFDPAKIKALLEKNIHVKLYRAPVKNIKDFSGDSIVEKLSVKKGIANIALISRQAIEAPFKEIVPPKTSIGEMKDRLTEDEKVLEKIKADLKKHICYVENFIKIKKSLEKELELQNALSGMGEYGNIVYLKGFAPRDTVSSLLETSKKERWAMLVDDPSPEDKVPTFIRNPRWVSIIAPVFKILEVVPGYEELDISLWFLLFLSVFFGMLIGDAGYGIVFFILTAFAQIKIGKKAKSKALFTLLYIFSSCAIVWGVLTGTFFGQEWLPQTIKPLMPELRNSRNVQELCFLIGVIHLSIAHMWRAIIKLPSSKALADIGWISILCGVFFLAKTLILGEVFPYFAKWFFIAGPVLVIFFTNLNLNRNVLKGIGSGFGNLLMNFVNSFTDVVSYVRLFAVGLATVAIADAFNKMALGIGFNGVLTGLATALILLLGHTLNILLGPLAVLVHGVRLNVLEFCNHVDIKWSGFSYKPLREE